MLRAPAGLQAGGAVAGSPWFGLRGASVPPLPFRRNPALFAGPSLALAPVMELCEALSCSNVGITGSQWVRTANACAHVRIMGFKRARTYVRTCPRKLT